MGPVIMAAAGYALSHASNDASARADVVGHQLHHDASQYYASQKLLHV